MLINANDLLVQYLKRHGPSRSSKIVSDLVRKGVSPEAARKRISRVSEPIMRLKGVRFPHKESFLYLDEAYPKPLFWKSLLAAFDETASAYGYALHGLLARGGVIPTSLFPTISGAPLRQQKQIGAMTLFDRLEAIGFLEKVDVPGFGNCVLVNPSAKFDLVSPGEARARFKVETILLYAVRDWIRKLGFASYGKIQIRELEGAGQPIVGTTQWDLGGPSYLFPLVELNGDKRTSPGFFVCDAFCGHVLDERQIGYFLRKCQLSRQLKNARPIFPVIIADHFTDNAFREGRSKGIVLATPSMLFGEDVSIALRELLGALCNAASVAATNPELVGNLISKLGKIEGAAINLRGDLFAMLVGYLVSELEGGSIDIGEMVRDYNTGETAEIDIRRVMGKGEVWCYECRARSVMTKLSLEDVRKWLEQKVPLMYRLIRQETRFSSARLGFELWTTGMFDTDSLAYMQRRKKDTNAYEINWKDGRSLMDCARMANRNSIVKILNEHYFDHPIPRAVQAAARRGKMVHGLPVRDV